MTTDELSRIIVGAVDESVEKAIQRAFTNTLKRTVEEAVRFEVGTELKKAKVEIIAAVNASAALAAKIEQKKISASLKKGTEPFSGELEIVKTKARWKNLEGYFYMVKLVPQGGLADLGLKDDVYNIELNPGDRAFVEGTVTYSEYKGSQRALIWAKKVSFDTPARSALEEAAADAVDADPDFTPAPLSEQVPEDPF